MWYEKDWSLAMEHLRALLAAGCEFQVGGPEWHRRCFYCNRHLGRESHLPDCPYVAAKEFFGSVDASQAQET
jgi:hypothetical protein